MALSDEGILMEKRFNCKILVDERDWQVDLGLVRLEDIMISMTKNFNLH